MSTVTNLNDPSTDNTFYFLCRLCALKCSMPGGIAIFSVEGIMADIYKKINDCLHIYIDTSDKFPKMICGDCLYKLNLCYEFTIKSLESQQFFSELNKHEQMDALFLSKNDEATIHNQDFQCLDMHDDLPDHAAIQVLEHFVDEANLNGGDAGDISKMIQYHDDEEIYVISDLANNDGRKSRTTSIGKDSISLPDIALYSFDSIPDPGPEVFLNESVMEQSHPSEYHQEITNPIENDKTHLPDVITPTIRSPQPVVVKQNIAKGPFSKTCDICGKTFRTNYKLSEHQRTHSNSILYKCAHTFCNKEFRSKIGLEQHESTHTGLYKHACDICGKGFQVKSYLTAHLRVHSTVKAFKCKMCNVELKSKKSLIDHENRHLGLKAFECVICNQKFITKSLLLSHSKTHLTGEAERKQYPCTVCNKWFVARSYLKTHMQTHDGNRKHVCEICGRALFTAVDLRKHMTLHTGEKKFVCEVCGKSFARQDALRIHGRSHTGEKPYSCRFCNQKFSQFTPMQIHMRTHTGERPYSCSLCQDRFVSNCALKAHLKKHNQQMDLEATYIENDIRNKIAIVQHMDTETGLHPSDDEQVFLAIANEINAHVNES